MRGLACAALFLSLSGAASAAIVHLRDGGKLEGTIVSATARSLTLHDGSGTREIETGRILRIEYAPESPLAPSPPEPPGPRTLDEGVRLRDGDDSVGVELGLNAPLSRLRFHSIGGGGGVNGDPGALLGAQWLHRLDPLLEIGAGVHYAQRSGTSALRLLPNAEASVHGDSLLLLALLKRYLRSQGSVRPYLLAGAGGHRTSTVVDAAPLFGFAWSDTQTDETRRLVDDAHWGVAALGRLGLEFSTFDPTLFSVEAGWTGASKAHYAAAPQGRALGLDGVAEPLHVFQLAARWAWRF